MGNVRNCKYLEVCSDIGILLEVERTFYDKMNYSSHQATKHGSVLFASKKLFMLHWHDNFHDNCFPYFAWDSQQSAGYIISGVKFSYALFWWQHRMHGKCYCNTIFKATFSSLRAPEGRPGMSDVLLLSGISGLSFDSPFLSPLLFFFCLVLLLFLSCHFPANGPFSWLFSRKLKHFSLRVRLFCMALVEQLGDDSC